MHRPAESTPLGMDMLAGLQSETTFWLKCVLRIISQLKPSVERLCLKERKFIGFRVELLFKCFFFTFILYFYMPHLDSVLSHWLAQSVGSWIHHNMKHLQGIGLCRDYTDNRYKNTDFTWDGIGCCTNLSVCVCGGAPDCLNVKLW